MKKHKIVLYHFVFWLGYMLISTLIEFAVNPKDYFFSIGDFFFTQFPNICTFYLCLFIYAKYANPLKIYSLIIGVISVYVFSYLHWYATAYYIRPLIKANGVPTPPFNFWIFAISVLWVYIKYSFFAFGYYYANENIKHQKQLRIIEEEKHQAQYAFLRAQINPHFLNNTLNFFYSKSLPLSKELAAGIVTLSEIMKYALADKNNRLVLIDEEIAHIKNVLEINQLRFSHRLKIKFEIQGTTKDVWIIPLILITIVENILKHGECTDSLNPVNITLNISDETEEIHLKTYNLKKNGPKELSSGIGMENIKKRINQHYGNHFKLSVIDNEMNYSLDLRLPQNHNSYI